ncbi:MAG: hypothetical protein JWP57_4088 [Spirosoma sp.]|nr:hypothetical protein [Spirosoma sp.]
MHKYSETLTAAILACAAYHKQLFELPKNAIQIGAHAAKLEKFLTTSLNAQAIICESLFPGWYADLQNPGYLIRQAPPAFFRVPAHLVAVFPNGDILQRIWELANAVRIHSSSIVCLSGSNVVKQIFEHVDDVDFCEYLPLSGGNAVADAVMSRAGGSDNLICTAVNACGLEWTPTSNNIEFRDSLVSTDFRIVDRSTLKMDFISRAAEIRPQDVTNLAIICDEDFKSSGFSKTFSFQEAHVSASDYVPNKLSNASEMGRYVWWLTTQVKKYKQERNLVKALKRALSLTRVCWMHNFSDEIKDFLSKTCLTIDQEIATSKVMKSRMATQANVSWSGELEKIDAHIDLLNAERHAFLFKQNVFYPGGEEVAAIKILSDILKYVSVKSGGVLQ